MTTPTFASDDAALPPEGPATSLGAARRPLATTAARQWNTLQQGRMRRLERAAALSQGKRVEADKVVATAALNGVPAPCMGSALSYYDGYRSEKLPANLLQGQRDYFGAHTYERTDQPRGKFFHIDWPEPGRPQLEM